MTVITQDRFGNHGERLEEGKMQARVQLDVPLARLQHGKIWKGVPCLCGVKSMM